MFQLWKGNLNNLRWRDTKGIYQQHVSTKIIIKGSSSNKTTEGEMMYWQGRKKNRKRKTI